MAFGWLPLVGNLIDSAFGLGSTKAQVNGATQAASEIEKANTGAYNYLTGRAQQGRNDILEQSAQGRQLLEPYINNGSLANNTLTGEVVNGGLNRQFTNADFQASPGYEFTRNEGNRGVQSSAAAGGNLFSGGTLKALQRYNTGLASKEWNNERNYFTDNQNQRFGQLNALSGQGLNAAGQGANMYQQTGNQLLGEALPTAALGGSYLTNIGEAQAAARAQRGSAYGNLYNDMSGNAQNILGLLKRKPATETLSY